MMTTTSPPTRFSLLRRLLGVVTTVPGSASRATASGIIAPTDRRPARQLARSRSAQELEWTRSNLG